MRRRREEDDFTFSDEVVERNTANSFFFILF